MDGQTVEVQRKPPASYGYDHVCDEHQTQSEIFESVGVPVTDAFLEGYHGCLIAYGQTGAGKTFTMQGPSDDLEEGATERVSLAEDANALSADDPEAQGLIPRVLQRVFQRVEDEKRGVGVPEGEPAPVDVAFTVKCSYLEISNEQVADLLARPTPIADPRRARRRRSASTTGAACSWRVLPRRW